MRNELEEFESQDKSGIIILFIIFIIGWVTVVISTFLRDYIFSVVGYWTIILSGAGSFAIMKKYNYLKKKYKEDE